MRKTSVTSEAPSETSSTADALLDTAEHLFATQGIENVSLRKIAAECGHGNPSGALYHFGSRETLIRRLIERRMTVVDKIRHTKLDEVLNAGQQDDATAIIAAAVNVLADVVRMYPWGTDYVLVISQAMFNPKIEFFTASEVQSISGLTRTTAMLRRLLPDVPQEKFDKRMRIVLLESVYAFARWLQAHGSLTKSNQASFKTMVEAVTEFMTGGMLAPVIGKENKRTRTKIPALQE
jgi:AcrR family transcriptional regulator